MKKKYIFIATIFTCIWLSEYIYKWEFRDHSFEVTFFSLNRGRAIFIRSPENKIILIGGGQNSDTIRELTRVMPFYKKKVDYIFIPSATPAQVGGLIEIIDRYEVEEIIISEITATSTVLAQLVKEIHKNKIHIKKVKRGDVLEIGGLKIKVFFPHENFKFNKSSLPELGLSIEEGSTGLYLFGNLSKTIQKGVLKSLDVMTTQNLLEFYHSATGAKVSDDLVDALSPQFIFSTKEKTSTWVSDGEEWRKK